ncbi:MAG TPA: hypothetical protein VKU00_08575 [Chthonomonadaceae bacterium]|nr:hypothetical protein [Chthonomonadaceae bacterium]
MLRCHSVAIALLFFFTLPACLLGCRRQESPAAPAVSYARVDAIVKSSGGNWKNVPPADQKYIIQTFGNGDTRVGTMVFSRRSAGMNAYLRWNQKLEGMVKKSGGDWSKLSQKDRNYLIEIVSKGDEKAAMKAFQARAQLTKKSFH